MLRGSYPAKIDDRGRLKLPTAFKDWFVEQHGTGLYVTSLTGESVHVYPMPVWAGIEERLSKVPSSHPARQKYLDRVNYFGQVTEFDAQGRVLIPARVRESSGMTGEVDVLGQADYLEVWNHDRFLAKLLREPFTPDDARQLADFGF